MERMASKQEIANAGIIAETFHIDPITVLDADYFDWCVRIQAFNAVMKDKERQNKEQEARIKAQQYKK